MCDEGTHLHSHVVLDTLRLLWLLDVRALWLRALRLALAHASAVDVWFPALLKRAVELGHVDALRSALDAGFAPAVAAGTRAALQRGVNFNRCESLRVALFEQQWPCAALLAADAHVDGESVQFALEQAHRMSARAAWLLLDSHRCSAFERSDVPFAARPIQSAAAMSKHAVVQAMIAHHIVSVALPFLQMRPLLLPQYCILSIVAYVAGPAFDEHETEHFKVRVLSQLARSVKKRRRAE